MRRKRGQKDMALATLTSNISHILNTLHPNHTPHSWKNCSAKVNTHKPASNNQTLKQAHKALMTEEDIDRLFSSNSRGKSKPQSVVSPKSKPPRRETPKKERGGKDFVGGCRFLQVD